MSEWLDRYRAYREQFNNAWLIPNEGREQNGPDESIELGEVVPHMEPPSVESLEQLSEWCGIVHSAHLLPDHLRQIQDSAENLGVRVKLPVLPMEAEFLNGRNQELMDRWKNIVTEFIESIKETNSKRMRIEKEANSTKTNGQKPTRPATVNQRMAGKITENYEALGWNSTQWAKHLKCAKSTVVATATWKQLKRAQQKAKAEGMKDRRRKPKASDSRRD